MSQGSTFGGWLRQRRTEQGATRDELSERLGFSLDLLRKLESGERRPSGQIAQLLADYFRIPADEREAFVTFARTGQAVSGDAGSTSPWRSTYVRHTNLPSLLTPLTGRERETTAAREQILNPRTRLLTLTGPPGIGKTRLGLEVASELVGQFDDGVFLVDLSPIVDPDLVLATVARTLGLKDEANRPLESVLSEFVRERRMLLLLDNFEQVLDAAPAIVRLMQASPWLKVLVTSREPLHVRGEKIMPVPVLQLPPMDFGFSIFDFRLDLASNPKSKIQNPKLVDLLAAYPSVELFVERAQAVLPDFTLTEGNAQDVAGVCIRAEGLPLAIELAAAHAGHLSPGEMRIAFDSRLKLLTQGARDLPPRHRTLRSAIEWSYQLLNEDEKLLFNRLGVFVGGCTLEAAQEVCNPEGSADFTSWMRSLVDKSLVKGEGGDGAWRYRMLESIREFALERLQELGEAETLGKAHALYFMRMGEEAKSALTRANDPGPVNRLGEDYDNVRTALHWARDNTRAGSNSLNGEPAGSTEAAEIGLRLAGAFWPYWYFNGFISEGREELAATLAAAKVPLLRPYMAEALNGAGALAYEQGDNAAARPLYETSLAIKRETGDLVGAASTLGNLGILAHEEGDHTSARAFYEESLAVSRKSGDKVGLSKALNNLAELVYDLGDYDYARTLTEESLAIKRELGNKLGIASSLTNLGVLAQRRGDYAAARTFHEESLAVRREIGDRRGIATSLYNLGLVAYDAGDNASALSLHQEGLAIRWEMGARLLVLDSLVALGRLAAEVGDAHRGARLLGAAVALREAMGAVPTVDIRTLYEQGLVSAQARLDKEAFEQAWAEGHAMSMEEAVGYAQATSGQ